MTETATRLALIGTGLIGASIGLAAKRVGVERVQGYDADGESLALAADRGAVDVPSERLEDAVKGVDLVVVATPVSTIPALAAEVLDAIDDDCTVTDVGSTKGDVCTALAREARFVGGHPVCGSEAHGPASATADLFEGATWFLTPLAETEPDRYRIVHDFVAALGAVPVAIDPRAHDQLVALTSHLPHALANILVNHAGATRIEGHEPLASAGGSLRDMTRVAGANPSVWLDILITNAGAVVPALEEHRRRVEELEHMLRSGDSAGVSEWIGEAVRNRQRLLASAYSSAEDLFYLRVHVPDRPGELARITQTLGAAGINIEGFDLEHFSRERGGVLTLLVTGESDAAGAAVLLEDNGYGVVVSSVSSGDAPQ